MIKAMKLSHLLAGAAVLVTWTVIAHDAPAQVGERRGVAIDSRAAGGGASPSRGSIGADISPSSTAPEAGGNARLSGSATVDESDGRLNGNVSGGALAPSATGSLSGSTSADGSMSGNAGGAASTGGSAGATAGSEE